MFVEAVDTKGDKVDRFDFIIDTKIFKGDQIVAYLGQLGGTRTHASVVTTKGIRFQ